MFLVIGEEAHKFITKTLSQDPDMLEPLQVEVFLDEGLIRLFHVDDHAFTTNQAITSQSISIFVSGMKAKTSAELENSKTLYLELSFTSNDDYSAWYYPGHNRTPTKCESYVTRLTSDRDSRIKGIFETEIVRNKTVSIIGLGSGGSTCAVELAKTGVGNFILVDFDRLKVHNISRHSAGLSAVGRYKTRAVEEIIKNHNPMANIISHELDITESPDILERIVSDSDVVVVATDTQLSRYIVNEECLSQGTVAVYGGVYERAFAGEVLRVIPGKGACYSCMRDSMAELVRAVSPQQEFDYTDDEDFVAEPGLGLDVSFISLIHSKMALLTLIAEEETNLDDFEENMIIWTNASNPDAGELFARPMKSFFIRVGKNDNCPACSM